MSDKPQVKISIDGNELQVPAGSTIIKAAETIGKSIPHFCYHPGLPVVGQCRMCFVEIEGAPKLATACSTPVAEGMKILTGSEKVKAGQNATLEFTLLNHPLDCPICDRGGECKLQDFTYEYGPPRSRMDDEKIDRDKHRAISEQIVLDQERCILCTRCERFSAAVDGRGELIVENRGSENVINVFENRPMTSRFSGNVVDLCPVGALTAKDFRFQARPWELKSHDAICTGCSMGCNIEIHTKHRHPGIARPDQRPPRPEIERLVPRENAHVNTWWLCDAGRWGYHFQNDDASRIFDPQMRHARSESFQKASLREIQTLMDGQKGSWEFWCEDSISHEEIAWAKDLKSSWIARGRAVSGINPGKHGEDFFQFLGARSSHPWISSQPNWSSIKTVVCSMNVRDLEDQVPILALKLGQRVREGSLQWIVREPGSWHKKEDDLVATAYLLPTPKTQRCLKDLEALPLQANVLFLYANVNTRGLVQEGIAPTEILEEQLEQSRPGGPVFLFAQKTQKPRSKALIQYLLKAPFLVIADAFKNDAESRADVLLPVAPLYESHATFTNIENYRQKSNGVSIEHPNYSSIKRGGEAVPSALKLL